MAKRIRVQPGPVAFRYARQLIELEQRGDVIILKMGDTHLMKGVVETQMRSLRDDVINQVAEAIQKGINTIVKPNSVIQEIAAEQGPTSRDNA